MAKPTWRPAWESEQRNPSFIGDGPPLARFGGEEQKYVWGNVPALNVINSSQNEGDTLPEDLRLLFPGKRTYLHCSKINKLAANYGKRLGI